MLEDETQFNNERNWNREAYYSRAQTEVHGVPQGASLKVKAECRGRQDLGRLPFLGFMSGLLERSPAKAISVNSNQKSRKIPRVQTLTS